MEWIRENWFFLLFFILFVAMHLFGHGIHGMGCGGHGGGSGEHKGHGEGPERRRKRREAMDAAEDTCSKLVDGNLFSYFFCQGC